MTLNALNNPNDSSSIFESLNPTRAAEKGKAGSAEEMGSEEFLQLMIAQLENQDPTKPMDQMAFMSQLAQFTQVSGIQELNESFSGLTETLTGQQALQASQMVGRSVSTNSNVGNLSVLGTSNDGNPVMRMSASVDLGNNASGGSFFVKDMSGQLVFSGTLPAGSGTLPVVWDGIDAEGNALPPGQYRISAEVERNGANQAASVFAHEQVVSVAIGAGNTVTLNLANGQSLGINEVKEFF